ncbi:MAG: hypothetical protein KF803_12815 [Cyclobacteriaceae bacterium]|nr:hypothetical protein [Cyclobacteriaceae bacterium]
MKTKLTILTLVIAATITTLSFSFGSGRQNTIENDTNAPATFEAPAGGLISEKI